MSVPVFTPPPPRSRKDDRRRRANDHKQGDERLLLLGALLDIRQILRTTQPPASAVAAVGVIADRALGAVGL